MQIKYDVFKHRSITLTCVIKIQRGCFYRTSLNHKVLEDGKASQACFTLTARSRHPLLTSDGDSTVGWIDF